MVTSIDFKFTFDSARLGLFSSANILQIADVALQVVLLLFLPYFLVFFSRVLTLETSAVRNFLFSQPKQLNRVSRSFLVNSALTCRNAAFLTQYSQQRKILGGKVSLGSRRLEVVGERENGRARGGHARGEGATSPLACLLLAHSLSPFGGWGKEIDDILSVV